MSCFFFIAVLSVSHAYGFIREVPQQYPTIASALVTPNPNDTILLSAGTYREQIVVNIDVTIASSCSEGIFQPSNNRFDGNRKQLLREPTSFAYKTAVKLQRKQSSA